MWAKFWQTANIDAAMMVSIQIMFLTVFKYDYCNFINKSPLQLY